MEISNQKQQAGDNSTQMQGNNITNYITNNYGIDEQRARAICKEEYALACQNWTKEAIAVANERVNTLAILLKASDNSQFIEDFLPEKVIYELKDEKTYENERIGTSPDGN